MNPECASPGLLTQLRSAKKAHGRCVEVEMLCGGERSVFRSDAPTGQKRDTKYGMESSLIQCVWGGGSAGRHLPVRYNLAEIN